MEVIKAEQLTAFVASKYPGQIVTLLDASQDICSDRWIISCRVGGCSPMSGVWYATSEEIVNAQAEVVRYDARSAELARRETTTTTTGDIPYGAALNRDVCDALEVANQQYMDAARMYGIDPSVLNGGDDRAALVREIQRTPLLKRAGKTAAMGQFTAMRAMAGVMGQVQQALWTIAYEDEAFALGGKYDDGLAAAIALPGAMDRAAARWSAQVRARVKARDEANRVRVWCQGEED